MLSKVSSQSVKCVVSRGRPLSLFIIRYRGGGKEGLVEACTSFHVIPLDSWGTILSVYCLCRGVTFRDVELNTRIKTVLSSLRMLFGRRCIIQLQCVELHWNMDSYLAANRKKQFLPFYRNKMQLFLYQLAMASHCYSLLPPIYNKLRNVENKSIVTDFPPQKQYLKAILIPRNTCNTFVRV